VFRRSKVRVVPVSLGERIVKFAVDPGSTDPIAQMLSAGDFPRDAVNDLWRHLIGPDQLAVDVGAHLGAYCLPAAACGAQVLAVEASPINAGLLENSAKSNGFANLRIVHAVAAAGQGIAQFAELGPFGHVALAGERSVDVAAVAIDDLLGDGGYGDADVIKIDVEGFELDVLSGLATQLARSDAPVIFIEANGHMLHQYGHNPSEILALLERFGYRCHLIDPGEGKRLIPVAAVDVQPECVADYAAFKDIPQMLAPWWVDKPFERAEVIRRVVATCEHDEPPHRAYGRRLLSDSTPAWLANDPAVKGVAET
jgi:FkbM family methyltransferase